MRLDGVCAIAVMAKAPRPGRVTTRLQGLLTAGEAARMGAAFLSHATANVQAAGRIAPIHGFVAYASEERLADGGVVLLRLLALFGPLPPWAGPGYLALALLGLAALAVAVVRRPLPFDPARRAVAVCSDALWLGTATMAALSPHYPWYLAGLAWPAVLAPRASALWLTLAAPALYLDPNHDQALWPALVFLPFAGLLAWELLRPARLNPLPAPGGL